MTDIALLLTAPTTTIAEVKQHAAALEKATGLKFTDYARYGCRPGTCKCPTRFARCRAWTLFEAAIRSQEGIPEPEPQRIINKYGRDVTGTIYPSMTAAMNDIYGSLCE